MSDLKPLYLSGPGDTRDQAAAAFAGARGWEWKTDGKTVIVLRGDARVYRLTLALADQGFVWMVYEDAEP